MISMAVETYVYKKGKKFYWEWRHAAAKVLQEIVHLRYLRRRFHFDVDCSYKSDEHYVEALIEAVKRYRSFLDELDNPIEYRVRK